MDHENDRETPRTRAGKTRLRSIADLDHRTSSARRARDLVAGLEADLGGTEALSTGQREIVRRVASASMMAEDLECRWIQGETVDLSGYTALVNTERRLLATVGLERQSRLVGDALDPDASAFMKEFDAAGATP